MKKLTIFLLACVLLCGCTAQPALSLQTTEPVPETTIAPETTVPATVPEIIEPAMPTVTGLEPGYYLISSVGKDGNISFYGNMHPDNGWLILNGDGTGTFFFEGVEGELTWEEDTIYWQGKTLMGLTARYYDSELDREDVMVMLYFMDPEVSVALRPGPMPE